ncbi:MAG: hypothetical protein IH944_09815 [Armatimonadetes bacterium]|nr:hypothetical protein [Armatimonadota bacterium]
MKKWVAWSFFGVAVLSIFLVKMFVPTTLTGPVSVVDLIELTDASLAPGLYTVWIDELKADAPDSSRLSQVQGQLVHAGLASDSEWQELLGSIEGATPWELLDSTPVVPVSSLEELIASVWWNLARARLLLDQGSDEEACDLVAELSRQTALGLEVATSPDDLAIAGASRGLVLRFAARNADALRSCGLGGSWVTAAHRERLFEVLQADFFEELLPQISEMSGREPWEWAPDVSGLPDNDASQEFFRYVLSGHAAAFDPAETATVASDDLVGLRTGLSARWRAFEAWSDGRLARAAQVIPNVVFQLSSENLDSSILRASVKMLLADSDNPLGALMLDAVVQNYASAAENAYLMDFQEAAVLFALTGADVTSPISGALLSPPVDGVFSESISIVDERFLLIQSLAESGWQP